MNDTIKARALELGFDACRVTTARAPESSSQFLDWLSGHRQGTMGYLERNAHKRIDPQAVLQKSRSIVTVLLNYTTANTRSRRSTEAGDARGIIARYARYEDYHDIMGARLRDLAAFIDTLGDRQTRSLWYVDTGPVLERDLAQRAGLGFIGKHTNLISRRLGNWILLGEILTTLDLTPDASEPNRCGTCTRCIDACPTRAIEAPFRLDARRCISYLTIELKDSIPLELRTAIGDRIFGCDDCLEVCPWNRFASEAREMRDYRRQDLENPDLLELLRLNEVGFRERFKGTPLLRAKRRGLLRNVCVALGNTGGEESLPALEMAARDPEPLIVEHARWAVAEVKRRLDEA